MSTRRLVDIEESLYYAVFDYLSDPVSNITLTTSDGLTYSGFPRLPVNYFREVSVYRNGVPVLPEDYVINYRDAKVTFRSVNALTDIVTVDYYYVVPNIVLAFPDMLNAEIILPTVAIEYDMTMSEAVEIGSRFRRKYSDKFSIGVYASSVVEKYILSDRLTNGLLLRAVPIIDLSLGYPLKPDGTKNPDFDYWGQVKGYMEFEDIITRSFRSERFGDVELNVMIIDFTVVSYQL